MAASPIQLKQKKIYRSIVSLKPTELPNLTVLTGINGSGKSHLLEAISKGHVGVDIAPNPSNDIRLVTLANLIPQDVGVTNIVQINANRDFFIASVRNLKAQFDQQLLDTVSELKLAPLTSDLWKIFTWNDEEIRKKLTEIHAELPADQIEAIFSDVKGRLNNIEDNIRASIESQVNGQDEFKKVIFKDLLQKKFKFINISRNNYDDVTGGRYGLDIFQHSFGELFFAYFERVKENRLRKMDEDAGRELDAPSLSEGDFVAKFGGPPWEFVNETLKVARLDFEIDRPVEYSATEYVPRLTKISTGQDIIFSSLSSGEKILMSFAFALYNSADHRQNISRPKLLLFDEVDAPLHPSMSKVLIDIIRSMLIEKEGIPVILVTHSPSTVAVSPDSSIHLLEPVTNRIFHEAKRRAVSSLTADIPTMSIDFEGRRQIFVEDDYDAYRYGLLYQIFAPQLKSERSLMFIGIGRQADAGITGSAQVKTIVSSLVAAGNSSVFGLIDWDTTNESRDRILVLGEGDRYAVENYLLDPVLIAAAVLNVDSSATSALGLPSNCTFVTFSTMSDAELQAASSSVQKRILNRRNVKGNEEMISCSYLGGHTISVDRRYMHYNGHKLEAAVLDEFPNLRRYNHNTGELLKHMIDTVVRNHPTLAPKPLFDAMVSLCDQQT
ncbi:AAA family ATPase [Mesorhizobium sp. M0053]|uniref:AAA family ATPase n=1 Tax=Mesorhizobium sp. M0053 TaxID=2956864 RepID=UPI003337FB8B